MDTLRAVGWVVRRIRSLDGLRGIAAGVVVMNHVILASVPALGAVGSIDGAKVHLTTLGLLLARTPLALFWSGPEFVIVFFVLSGFVLTVQVLDRGATWSAYYPSRLLRLYLPVWAAIVLALAWYRIVTPHTIHGASIWLNGTVGPVTSRSLLDLATLIPNVGATPIMSVLWSLHWEILFSLALPFAVMFVVRFPTWLVIPAAIIAVLIPHLPHLGWAYYVMPFIVGAALATKRDELIRIAGRRMAVALALCAVGGLSADAWLVGGSPVASPLAENVAHTLVVVGAMAAVVFALAYRRIFETRPVQWIGTRSFTLYLVHLPVVVSVAFLLHAPGWPLEALVAVPTALLLTEAFYRLVEVPSHRIARAAGRLAPSRARAASALRRADAAGRDQVAVHDATERPYVLGAGLTDALD